MFTLRKQTVGLDISDHTIEVVELEKRGARANLLAQGRIKLEKGIVENGRIQNEEALSAAIKNLFATTKPNPIKNKNVVFGLPESHIYTHAFHLEITDEKKIQTLLPNALEKIVPIEKENLIYSYKIINKAKNGSDILVVASSKEVVNEWQTFLQKQGLEIEALDVETLASVRDLAKNISQFPACVVDLGSRTTNVAIFDKQGLVYTQTIFTAGDSFTKTLTQYYNNDAGQAEEAKKSFGLEQENKLATQAISAQVTNLANEIKRTFDFFEKRKNKAISEIILVGGTARLKGLPELFKKILNKPVRIGSSAIGQATEPLEYIGAIGLALRGVEQRWKTTDPSIPLLKIEKTEKKSLPLPEASEEEKPLKPKKYNLFLWYSNHKQETLLITIIIFGIILVASLYIYKNTKKTPKESQRVEDVLSSLDALLGQHTNKNNIQTLEGQKSENQEIFTDTQITNEQSPFIQPGPEDKKIRAKLSEKIQIQIQKGKEIIQTEFEIVKDHLFKLNEEHPSGLYFNIQIDETSSGWVQTKYFEKVN